MLKTSAQLVIGAALLIAAQTAFAGESSTVQISCTIPSIPGVNAPLQEATSYVNPSQTIQDSGESDDKKDTKDDAGKIEVTEATQLAMVKTFYSK